MPMTQTILTDSLGHVWDNGSHFDMIDSGMKIGHI